MPTVIPEFWVFATACLGAIFGSYINMAAYRLPRGISTVTKTRSFCPSCKRQLPWYENLPILSYLFLLGRCRGCKALIGARYFLTEILVTLLFIAAAWQFFVLNRGPAGPMPAVLFGVQLFLIVDLILLSVVDLEAWLIPIETTLPWILVGLGLAIAFPALHPSATTWTASPRMNALIDSFMGLTMGAGVLWAIGFATTFFSYFYFKLKGRDDRPLEGMGAGDQHLLAMVGAMLGWKPVLLTIGLGIFIGCITGVMKILYEKWQRNRLGAAYKPWQPTYEMPTGTATAPYVPSFWPLLVMGLVVLLVCGFMSDLTRGSAGTLIPTSEEVALGVKPRPFGLDGRVMSLGLMGFIGVLLVLSFPFFKYLQHIGSLPQGDIQENEKGEKEEVLQGNYVPFGPSLALAALIVAFYDPLLRNVAFWFASGASGSLAALPYQLLAGGSIAAFLMAVLRAFSFSH